MTLGKGLISSFMLGGPKQGPTKLGALLPEPLSLSENAMLLKRAPLQPPLLELYYS